MELILVRHGLPERRDDTADPPLSEAGHDQARRVAAWLAHEKIDAVYASTMLRARQTAEPFAAQRAFEVSCHDGICEFDRDTGAYIPTEVLKRENYEAWLAMATGELGVDITAFQRPVVDTLEAIIEANQGRRVAVFCHGGVINVWTAHVLGMPARLFFEPDYTSIHRYMCARTGQRSVLGLNERAHLRG
ncbi:histidine phosphatase family protein [Phenylobacterium sp.]|uniref:histidine phosphatase family protein n=1 Tax=Phenylobacterium sp. TaxID=1871053 RepID=UPI0025EE0450|nr:histidine phosphatase family protein [Phenylobacterium sp.]MBX3483105.1 histidine phosphatase family protein [Phenylobacterium sp.]MCW5760311.1 histidine phosphatase family protein [Phenylobacterium sp.]